MTKSTINDIEFILPCGGFGTRNYPHSKGLAHKGLMPFGDTRLIDFTLSQIVAVGGKHVTFVCSNPSVIDTFKNALATDDATEQKLRGKGFTGIADTLKSTFLPSDMDVKYVIQDEPLGTGHVLGLAHRVSPNRHGMMIFPDDIIVSNPSHLQRMIDQFLLDEHKMQCYGVPKEDVSNNAIVVNNRLVEKPKNPANKIGTYSPYIIPREMLDFMTAQLPNMKQKAATREWGYYDGVNEFLDAQGPNTPFGIDVVLTAPTDILIDTGTLPLYEKAQLFALLKLSRFKEDNKKYIQELLKG